MDKLINRAMLIFCLLILFDSIALDVNVVKQRFGLFGAITSTVSSAVSFVKAVK